MTPAKHTPEGELDRLAAIVQAADTGLNRKSAVVDLDLLRGLLSLIADYREAVEALRDVNAAIDAFWNADPRSREPEIKALTAAQISSFAVLAKITDRQDGRA